MSAQREHSPGHPGQSSSAGTSNDPLLEAGLLSGIPYFGVNLGQEIQKFTDVTRIAGSPNSSVSLYRATNIEKNRKCVLKSYDKKKMGEARARTIAGSIRIHALLTGHANISTLHAVIESPAFLVTEVEYCRYGDLFGVVTSVGKLPPANALSVMLQVAEGLIFMHQRGFVHRDLKPENILIDSRGVAKLSDFDLATSWSPFTSQRQFCGTKEYASPEMLIGIPYIGPEVDIWSFGISLYVLLHRRFPFTQQYYDQPRMDLLTSFQDTLSPPSTRAIIQGCLNPSPRVRWTEQVLRNVLKEAICSEVGLNDMTDINDVTFNFSDTSESDASDAFSSVSGHSTRSAGGFKEARSIGDKVTTRGKSGGSRISRFLKKFVSKNKDYEGMPQHSSDDDSD